jgi:tetratricopeptide (TPR) repeat protein
MSALLAGSALVAQEPAAPVKPGPGKAEWAETFAAARSRARAQNKLVYVEFTRKECGNCVRMAGLLYPAVDFEMTLLRMVPVRLDLDKVEEATLAARYGIKEAPAVLVLAPGGALVFRVVGFDDQRQFYAHIRRALKEYDEFNVRVIHEPEKIDDPAEELALGVEYFKRLDPEEAQPRFSRAAASPKAPASVREKALSYLASARFQTGDFSGSRKAIEDLLKATKDPDEIEQAELFRAQILLAEGKPGPARKQYVFFLQKYPQSKRRDDVERILTRLEQAENRTGEAKDKKK